MRSADFLLNTFVGSSYSRSSPSETEIASHHSSVSSAYPDIQIESKTKIHLSLPLRPPSRCVMTGGAARALVIAEPLVSGGSVLRPHTAQPGPASPIDADFLFDCSLDKTSGAELIPHLRAQRESGAGATSSTLTCASFSPSTLGQPPPGRLALPRSQPMAIQHTRDSYVSLAAQGKGKCNINPMGDFTLGSTPRIWKTEDEPPVRARAAYPAAARPCPPRQRVTTLTPTTPPASSARVSTPRSCLRAPDL